MADEEKLFGDDLYITIKTDEEDFQLFQDLVPSRLKKMAAASDKQEDDEIGCVNILANRLHPTCQHLVVKEINQITPSIKLFKLVSKENKELAYFRPGQYLSLDLNIGQSRITRPYSIASSPDDTLSGYYEVAIKDNEEGFASKYFFNEVKVGDEINASAPCGHFYFDDIRDKHHIVGIAGGSGITPFRSMARSIISGAIDCDMTLFYGATSEKELAFKDEFKEIEAKSKGKFKVIFVLSNETKDGYEHGFIGKDILTKYVNLHEVTTFICGPQVMYQFIEKELKPLNIRRKLVRFELFGQPTSIVDEEGFPKDAINKTFKVTVHQGALTKVIDAKASETLVVSMERAGIRPPTNCRSGMCGFCRSQLVKGDVYVAKKDDGRRYGDKKFGFIHPCASYPLSDLEIIVPPCKQ